MKKWVGYLIAGLSTLGAILAFVLWRKYQKDHVDTLKDALAVSKAERAVAALSAKREVVEERTGERAIGIAIIDKKLDDNKRTIVEARTKTKNLTQDQVLAEYRRLGYIK